VLDIRSIFSEIPVLGLSATITEKVLRDLKLKMNFEDADVVVKSLPPDRPNIFLDISHQQSYKLKRDLQWLIDSLREKQLSQPKTIIFAEGLAEVSEIFETFMWELGDQGYVNGERNAKMKLVSMYNGQVSRESQVFILNEFRKPESVIRVLVSTIAFGMGVEIKDIREVIHWGCGKDVMGYWQQVGRCGRDGKPSRALLYPKVAAGDDKEVFQKLKKDSTVCIRETLLNVFLIPGMDVTSLKSLADRQPCSSLETCCRPVCTCPLCVCCCNCRRRCRCCKI